VGEGEFTGIVDEPRPIAGGTNQDNYPLVLTRNLRRDSGNDYARSEEET
jgi:hypothetical protein